MPIVYDLKTGERLERFAVDANAMVAQNEGKDYAFELPAGFKAPKGKVVDLEPEAAPAPGSVAVAPVVAPLVPTPVFPASPVVAAPKKPGRKPRAK